MINWSSSQVESSLLKFNSTWFEFFNLKIRLESSFSIQELNLSNSVFCQNLLKDAKISIKSIIALSYCISLAKSKYCWINIAFSMLLMLHSQYFWCCEINAFNVAKSMLLILLNQCFWYCFSNITFDGAFLILLCCLINAAFTA